MFYFIIITTIIIIVVAVIITIIIIKKQKMAALFACCKSGDSEGYRYSIGDERYYDLRTDPIVCPIDHNDPPRSPFLYTEHSVPKPSTPETDNCIVFSTRPIHIGGVEANGITIPVNYTLAFKRFCNKTLPALAKSVVETPHNFSFLYTPEKEDGCEYRFHSYRGAFRVACKFSSDYGDVWMVGEVPISTQAERQQQRDRIMDIAARLCDRISAAQMDRTVEIIAELML